MKQGDVIFTPATPFYIQFIHPPALIREQFREEAERRLFVVTSMKTINRAGVSQLKLQGVETELVVDMITDCITWKTLHVQGLGHYVGGPFLAWRDVINLNPIHWDTAVT
jgi:hypothetical protein